MTFQRSRRRHRTATQSKPAPTKPAKPRTHTVVAGETAVGIARKAGVKLSDAGGGESRHESGPDSRRTGVEPSAAVKVGMITRGAFILVAAFWVAMNVLLWRAEYGSHNGGIPVPLDLVCRKILTAPDTSSLNVYQDGQKMGFCEFSTSVEQEMAELDEDNPPPEGLVARAGYQVRLNGNVAFGEFTNRVKFDGARQVFAAPRMARVESENLHTLRHG